MKKFIVLILVLLSACHHLEEGVIEEKIYEEGHSYTTTGIMLVGKVSVPVVYHWYDDPDYVITIRGTYKGKQRTETWYVDQDQWDTLKVGSLWCKQGNCSTEDNHTKTK